MISEEYQTTPMTNRQANFPRRCVLLLIVFVILTLLLGEFDRRITEWHRSKYALLPPSAGEVARQKERDRIRDGGKYFKPLKILAEIPGVDQPELLAAGQVGLPDSTEVVGIEVGGRAFAFDLASMKKPERHIVNMTVDGQAISVTYCDLVDCVRVLTKASDDSIPLQVGGLDIDNQLVFLLSGERYGQESRGLPLDDHAFERTSLGKWKQRFPSTLVYTEGSAG